MYIPKHNAFFFHTPKAGGTSIEIFFLNDDGVYINHHNLSKRLNQQQREKYKIATEWLPSPYTSQHATCEHVVQTELWKKVNYSFTIVRNPWDRVISEWKYLQQETNKLTITLDEVINMFIVGSGAHFIPQWKYAYLNDNLVVDDIFKLEDIAAAEKKLSEVFNIQVKIPRFNNTHRDNDYRKYFTQEQLDKLENVLEKDARTFNYVF